MHSNKISKRAYAVSMFGTALEHYDTSLYGFMAPILVAIFLPDIDPLNALIISLISYPVGILSKPLGAIIIGAIGDRFGRKKALTIAISGTAISTGMIGLLPGYDDIGIAAPLLFVACRLVLGFFSAGEYNGGAIYILEHAKDGKKGYVSGLYCAYTVSGILVAAAVSTVISYLPQGYWRVPYLLGFITGAFGFYIRMKAHESPEFLSKKTSSNLSWSLIKAYSKQIICIVGVAGLFSSLYTLPTLLLTAFVPLVTTLTIQTVMVINSASLVIYMMMLPVSGWLADRFGLARSMIAAIIATMLLSYPLIALLPDGSFLEVFLVKAIFAILTAWFVGPFHALAQAAFHVSTRYSLISLGYTVGSQIGSITPGLGLWLWKQTGNVSSISILLVFWSLVGLMSCIMLKKRTIDT